MGAKHSDQYVEEDDLYAQNTHEIFLSEDLIRLYEINFILNYRTTKLRDFKDLIIYFCCDFSILKGVQGTLNYIKLHFGESFEHLINSSPFFRIPNENNIYNNKKISLIGDNSTLFVKNNDMSIYQNNLFDINKLRALIFLISNETLIDYRIENEGKIKLYDKAIFLYNTFQIQIDTDKLVIDSDDPKFNNFLSDLFDISCIELIRSYTNHKEVHSDNHINLIYKVKDKVISLIKDMMFKDCVDQIKQLSFENINNLFENYSDSFLSSKFFRMKTFNLLIKNNKPKIKRRCC